MQTGQVETITTAITSFFSDVFIPVAMLIATVVLIAYGIINAIRYAKAGSDEEKQKAKKNIIGIVIGAAVCVASIWLIPLIINLFSQRLGTNSDVNINCIGMAAMLPIWF